jgi:hypothetical protein
LKMSPPTILLLCVFAATGTCLQTSCLATIEGTHIQTHRLVEAIIENNVEMDSDAVIYTKFHINLFRNSKLMKGIHRHTDKAISLAYFPFLKIRKVG